jgi:hypothetical protein
MLLFEVMKAIDRESSQKKEMQIYITTTSTSKDLEISHSKPQVGNYVWCQFPGCRNHSCLGMPSKDISSHRILQITQQQRTDESTDHHEGQVNSFVAASILTPAHLTTRDHIDKIMKQGGTKNIGKGLIDKPVP